jgi:hypothetical protein
MQSVVGIFRSCASAESAVGGLLNHGIPRRSIILLSRECPGEPRGREPERTLDEIPTTDAEPDGMGKGVGAVVGGALGASAGLAGGAAVASMLVPGVGTIFAAGLGAAALLGLGGAAAGAKAGDVTEHALDIGVPKDDVPLYHEILKQGRSLVIANLEDEALAASAKRVFEQHQTEDIEAARKRWRTAA